MKTKRNFALALAATMLLLSGCMSRSISVGSVTQTTSVKAEAVEETTVESAESSAKSSEAGYENAEMDASNIDFYLTEDDIAYNGILYKDLTLDQFVALWGECETNLDIQRLYVLEYCNCLEKGEAETDEEYNQRCEDNIKDGLVTTSKYYNNNNLSLQFYDVTIHRYDENEIDIEAGDPVPEGYYDDETKEKQYILTYTDYEKFKNETSYVTIKKVNGYWKIGNMRSSSPYIFDINRLY